MDIPISELFSVFTIVAESNNFREAAKKLQISQPAVSFKIKQLEKRLPLPIFTLQGKKKVLTHYGEELHSIARENLSEFTKCFETLNRTFSTPEKLTLKIGCRAELFECLSEKFNFGGKVQHFSYSSEEAVKALKERKIDIGIVHRRPDLTEVMSKKLMSSRAVFVVHDRFLKPKLSAKDALKDSSFLEMTPSLLYGNDGHLLRPILEKLSVPVSKLNIRYVTNDWRSIAKLAASGCGYAVIPDYIADLYQGLNKVEVAESAVPKFDFYAIYSKQLLAFPGFKNLRI